MSIGTALGIPATRGEKYLNVRSTLPAISASPVRCARASKFQTETALALGSAPS